MILNISNGGISIEKQAKKLESELAVFFEPEIYADLLVLYCQSTEIGFSTENNLPLDFIKYSGQRLSELSEQYMEMYGEIVQCYFWTNYIKWIDWGEEIDLNKLLSLMNKNPKFIEPHIYIYPIFPSKKSEEMLRVIITKANRKTIRSEYVYSVAVSLLRKQQLYT